MNNPWAFMQVAEAVGKVPRGAPAARQAGSILHPFTAGLAAVSDELRHMIDHLGQSAADAILSAVLDPSLSVNAHGLQPICDRLGDILKQRSADDAG